MRISYKTKLLFFFTLLFAAFTLLLVLFQQNHERQHSRRLLETRLRAYADIVDASIEKHQHHCDSTELAHLTALLPHDLRSTVITDKGVVVFETEEKLPGSMDNHENRPEVQLAKKHGEGSDIRQSLTTHTEYFYFAKNYGDLIVRVALPYNATVQNLLKADNIFLWFVLMLFPVVLVLLIYLTDHIGKSIASLRHFIDSAERGLIAYEHISFPHTELGEVSRAITQKYQQLEESNRRIALERERLMRHFQYFEEGIAIFHENTDNAAPSSLRKLYANPRFVQYVNTILDSPTPDLERLWQHQAFAPALRFVQAHCSSPDTAVNSAPGINETPNFRYTIEAGSHHFAIQVLIFSDRSIELTLSDITRAEKNRILKQQMSNNITHELRTPVSSIRGYLETILQCPGISETQKHGFLEKAHLQSIRLSDLIRDVALISKTEEAPDAMPREMLSPAQIVADTAEELRAAIDEKGMHFTYDIPDTLRLNGNYSLLHAIFRNLMENSLRYAGPGTSMHTECYSEDATFCHFRFYDTGEGVEAQHLPRLFERFYRVSEGRTREGGGTGLGLSIVRNAVLFHSGNISVRNRIGGGLEFIFSLKK